MSKYFSLVMFLAISLGCPIVANTQDTINAYYFNNLKELLLKDPNVYKTKYIQKHIFSGKMLTQELYVKYKNDTLKRYWRIGKNFYYHNNGKLAFKSFVDIKSKILNDTTYYYDEQGKIIRVYIYDQDYPEIIPVKKVSDFFSIFSKFYENLPGKYKRIEFCDGTKLYEESRIYSEGKGFLLDGDAVYYKTDGTIDKVIKYCMGKEVTTP